MRKGQLLLTDKGLQILHHISMAIMKLILLLTQCLFLNDYSFFQTLFKKVVSTYTFMSVQPHYSTINYNNYC